MPTIAIVGAGPGLGLAIPRARVYLTGRREADVNSAARDLGPGTVPVRADDSDTADLDQSFKRVELDGQGLDVVSPTPEEADSPPSTS